MQIRVFFISAVCGVLLFPPEAQVSGSAGVVVLEEHVLYAYQESSRRKLRPEDYDTYFKERRDGMLGAISFSQSQLSQWRRSVAAAGIKLKPVPVFAEFDGADKSLVRIELKGERGTTDLTLALEQSSVDIEKLRELSRAIEFESLFKKWSDAGSPPYKPASYVSGAMEVRPFENFTLAMAVTSAMRKELQGSVQKELSIRLEKVATRIGPEFLKLVKAGEVWIEPSSLVSYKERFGALPSGDELQNPGASKFNFHGPLFDKHGGRTGKSFGVLSVSMLFLSKNENWESDPSYTKFGKNRGSFESWFDQIIKSDN